MRCIFLSFLLAAEPSVADDEEEEEEESRNRRQPKQTEATEQQDEEQQRQTNSTASSGSSQYFQTPATRETPSTEPTEIVVEQRRCSATMANDDSCARPSSMNMSTRGHIDDDDERREKHSEEKYRPMGAEHRSRTNQTTADDEQTCTIVTKNERRDNEIKSRLSFQANADPQFNEREKSQDKDMNTNGGFSLLTPRRINAAHAQEENDDLLSGKNRIAMTTTTTTTATTIATSPTMNQTEAYPPPSPPPSSFPPLPLISKATSKSAASYSITSTKAIHNNNNNNSIEDESRDGDDEYAEATPSGDERAASIVVIGENRRDREKGEREKREDNIKRTPTPTTREQEKTEERERVKQANKTTDSVTTFTSEQHSCPSVVRLSVDDSMAHRVSSSSSFNKNNQHQTTPSSNNRSSRSTYTTHTYASTNSFNTEPTYTSPPTTTTAGDPRTLHSCYVTSSNYHRPPTSPATSLTRPVRGYEPSYPSISRYRTPSSSSPYRKTHYLDDSDEEIINEEILEVTDMNHYPTLVERWGDDTKTVVRHEGELKIEDFVEFEEIEPTVIEEILYELIYAGDKLKTCRQISRSRSESRNFRKIKKRRTKRKRQPNDESSYMTSQTSSRDNSGTRSPYYNDQLYSPERSRTPVQQSVLSPPWQSTGFLSTDKSSSLDIPIRNRSDDRNYVNQIRVNESEPFLSHTQVQHYPYTQPANTTTYRTLQTEPLDSRSTDLIDEMRSLSSRIDALVKTDHTSDDDDDYRSSIGGTRGVTTIDLTPSRQHQSPSDNVIIGAISEAEKVRSSLLEQQQLLASSRTADDDNAGVGQALSRTTTSDQTSVPHELVGKL